MLARLAAGGRALPLTAYRTRKLSGTKFSDPISCDTADAGVEISPSDVQSMSLEATLAVALPRDHCLARRRTMNLRILSRQTGTRVVAAQVTDLSPSGCRLATSERLETSNLMWLKIAGLAPHRVRLEEQGGQLYRCQFVPPVQSGVVEDVLASHQRLRVNQLKAGARRFG